MQTATAIRIITLALTISAVLVTSASAATINPEADTVVNEENAGTVYGDADPLFTNRKGTVKHYYPYIRFDLSEFTQPMSLADSATFTWTYRSGTDINDVVVKMFGIVDGNTEETWIETGDGALTWNNSLFRNDDDGDDLVATGDLVYIGEWPNLTGASEGDEYSISNANLVSFIQNSTANDLVTLVVVPEYQNSVNTPARFDSLDGIAPPTLEVTFIPEPTSIVLLGLAGMGLLTRRRRR